MTTENKLFGVVEGFYGRPWTPTQRKELFKRMKQFGLNSYMYAPKDDFKHRAYWRELYSIEEAEQLSQLIKSAKENDILFYYAISPGLDMCYSNTKEVNCLKRKLEQVVQFGCEAFAILFDDIEPEISELDKEVFQSFGHAQVSVTNEIYQSLGQPHFLFCPTEYCASRAIPNVKTSEYLKTIGNKLIPEIAVFWTGNKVISKTLTVESLQELNEVLKRKAVIWDNLNANDFDQRRVFLGAYDGRSTDIKDHIGGIMTNPNCEFESNFIPFHSLANWSKCNDEIKLKPKSISNSLVDEEEEDLEFENGSKFDENHLNNLNPFTYHPRRALKLAIQAWLIEFNKQKTMSIKPADIISTPLANAVNNLITNTTTTTTTSSNTSTLNQSGEQTTTTTTTTSTDLIKEQIIDDLSTNIIINQQPITTDQLSLDSTFQPITKELTNSLLDPPVILNPLEPMDCDKTTTTPIQTQEDDENMEEMKTDPINSNPVSCSSSDNDLRLIKDDEQTNKESLEEMQTDGSPNEVTYEDINVLVDFFYLPFEHGKNGLKLLNEFNWLLNNSYLIANYRIKKSINPDKSAEVLEWFDKAIKFEKQANFVSKLLNKLIQSKNKCILYELYPYLWDINSVVSLLNSYVKWLSLGHLPTDPTNSTYLQTNYNWFSKGYKEAFSSGDQEPWLFRNGLTGDLQRLLPIESVNDLFIYKAPDSPSSHIFTIRPFNSATDEQFVYEICRKTSNLTNEVDYLFNDLPDLVGDKFVGSFLTLSPDFCFVVEDEMENKICGYILGALDSQQFQKKLEMAWMPDICLKYPAPIDKLNKGEKLTTVEQMINELHEDNKTKFTIPEMIHNNYPSICRINILDYVMDNDQSVPKRLLTCLLAAFKSNGSKGLFAQVNGLKDKKELEFYLKLGFQEIYCPIEIKQSENDIYLGRSI